MLVQSRVGVGHCGEALAEDGTTIPQIARVIFLVSQDLTTLKHNSHAVFINIDVRSQLVLSDPAS